MPKVMSKKPSIFSKKLTELRKSRQLTQEEFAEKIGLSLSTVAYYESAARNPKLETIYKISEFFGVSPERLIVEKDDTTNKPGPSSKLDDLLDRIKRLSPHKQRMIINMLEGALNSV